MAEPTKETVVIPPINIGETTFYVVGDESLICHNWSDKAKKQILDKQQHKANVKKPPKNPKKDFEDSLYPYPGGGYGFPTIAFKKAAVYACRNVDGMPMTLARGAFHVVGELVKIEGSKPTMREDMVMLSKGMADIRYRAEFKKWRAKLTVRYNKDVISLEQLLNLFHIAGFAIGAGNWRPEKDGNHGMYHIE